MMKDRAEHHTVQHRVVPNSRTGDEGKRRDGTGMASSPGSNRNDSIHTSLGGLPAER